MDTGSCCLLTHVNILSVLAYGVVDTAADITIMSGKLIATVAAAARLKKKDFRKPDKVPRTYERKVFRLDGCIKMDIIFQGMTINTIVYVKMDAANQLLLLECVCAQLHVYRNCEESSRLASFESQQKHICRCIGSQHLGEADTVG